MNKINISIPKPCHENWDAMSPQDKGRFCSSCQKKVIDFTKASDREIVIAFQQNQNLCGRFLATQFDRDLVKTEKKSRLWLAAVSAMISFIGFGTTKASAQNEVKTEQNPIESKPSNEAIKSQAEEIEVTGVVTDNTWPLPGAYIYVNGKQITRTDFDGNFILTAHTGDLVKVKFDEYEDYQFKVSPATKQIRVVLKELPQPMPPKVIMGYVIHKKKTK